MGARSPLSSSGESCRGTLCGGAGGPCGGAWAWRKPVRHELSRIRKRIVRPSGRLVFHSGRDLSFSYCYPIFKRMGYTKYSPFIRHPWRLRMLRISRPHYFAKAVHKSPLSMLACRDFDMITEAGCGRLALFARWIFAEKFPSDLPSPTACWRNALCSKIVPKTTLLTLSIVLNLS